MGLIDKDKEAATEDKTGEKTPDTNEEKTPDTNEEKTPDTKEVATHDAPNPLAEASPSSSVFITNPLFLDAVADAEYGTFTSIVASNGTHMVSGTEDDLGKVVKFQVIVAKNVWKVVPGSSDEEAKDYFCVSDDGIITNDGRDINDAVQTAIDAGYEKASVKKYIDVICLVTDCDNDDFVGETVTLQLAPSSQYTWKPLSGKCKMAQALGKLKAQPIAGNAELGSAVIFSSTATPTTWKGQNFTKFIFALA